MNSSSRCKGQTKSGNPCRAAAIAGGLCFFHANPNKTSELGRIGGPEQEPSSLGNHQSAAQTGKGECSARSAPGKSAFDAVNFCIAETLAKYTFGS
jgi:hypothetical protein